MTLLRITRQFHPDTHDYLDRVRRVGGAAVNPGRLNRYIQDIYLSGVRQRIRYLLVPGLVRGYAGCNVPVYAPSGVGNATLTGYSASDWSSAGLQGNGSSKYIRTGFIPSTHLSDSISSVHFSTWDTDRIFTSNYEIIGAESNPGYRVVLFWYGSANDDYGVEVGSYEGSSNAQFHSYSSSGLSSLGMANGLMTLNRVGTSGALYLGSTDITLDITRNVTATELPTVDFCYQALNNGGTVQRVMSSLFRAGTIGTGFSATEFIQHQSALGRLIDA